MPLTAQELAAWRFLTDGLPAPEEVPDPAAPAKVPCLRIFCVRPGDDRFPSYVSMPRLLRSAPARLRDEWVRIQWADLDLTPGHSYATIHRNLSEVGGTPPAPPQSPTAATAPCRWTQTSPPSCPAGGTAP